MPLSGNCSGFCSSHNDLRYITGNVIVAVIRSFADKEAESVWAGIASRRLPGSMQPVARRKLRMLNSAASLEDLRIPPANRLEALKGDRKGWYSIRINDQWRVCFQWSEGDAHGVQIVDYH